VPGIRLRNQECCSLHNHHQHTRTFLLDILNRSQASQGPYAQGPYPGQSVVSVVAVQPTVFVTAAPLANPVPDYLCYSIFTMVCCCLPLGIAALVFSCSVSISTFLLFMNYLFNLLSLKHN